MQVVRELVICALESSAKLPEIKAEQVEGAIFVLCGRRASKVCLSMSVRHGPCGIDTLHFERSGTYETGLGSDAVGATSRWLGQVTSGER